MRKTGRKDEGTIKRTFRARQTRQIIAMAAAMFLVLLGAVLHRRPDLFGEFSRGTLFGLQAISIGVFLGYTAQNWRCPSCNRHLGSNIFRSRCEKCGARLQ
jgi:tRNA(Ile2) C34 agmatinyltransferase TiaS